MATFIKSLNKETAINQLFNLVNSTNSNKHLLEWDYKDYSIEEIDNISLLILS